VCVFVHIPGKRAAEGKNAAFPMVVNPRKEFLLFSGACMVYVVPGKVAAPKEKRKGKEGRIQHKA
jgi:hypothetical protein